MTLSPLLEATANIQIHALAALLALCLGPVVLYRPRRGQGHKIMGYIWVCAMGAAALSSFTISGFGVVGPISPIHGLSVLALWSLWVGMGHAFAGRIAQHQTVMRALYWRGLYIAGLFNFLPGRAVNRMFFDEARDIGYAVIALGACALIAQWWMNRPTAAQPA